MQMFKNAEDDYTRVRVLKEQIAEILYYACTQACAKRGVRLSERQGEELQRLLEGFL